MSDQRDVKPWDLINGSPRTPDEIAESRLEICRSCEFYKPSRNQCKKCGCFMKLKTKLEEARCPIGKW